MGKKTLALMEAADEIRAALEALPGGAWVHVYESYQDMLRAVVASDYFKEMPISERQTRVWDYLEEKVAEASLECLYAVHPYSREEYVQLAPTTSTTSGSILSFPPDNGNTE